MKFFFYVFILSSLVVGHLSAAKINFDKLNLAGTYRCSLRSADKSGQDHNPRHVRIRQETNHHPFNRKNEIDCS